MNLWKLCVVLFSLTIYMAHAEPPQSVVNEFEKLSPEQIEKRLQSEHPAACIIYAGKLWAVGKKDEAVFWFYVGQLRYRFLLMAVPEDASAFGALMDVVGEPINIYAGSNPKKWVSQMDAALAWDKQNPNDFTSKTKYEKQLLEARNGLIKLKEYVSSHQEELNAQREQSGIGEIGLTNGVYVEEQKEKMPKDWPALASRSTLAQIVGTYPDSFEGLLGPILFFEDQYKVLKAKTFELSAPDAGSLLVIAKNGDTELLRRTIPVRQENDAIVFEEQRTAAQAGLSEGGVKEKVLLRANKDGDLVIQRDSLTEGKRLNKPTPLKLSYTFWNRAKRAESK